MTDVVKMTSNRSYLIRAFNEWIVDNYLTPYLMVNATVHGVQVPEKYIQDGKIILNISPDAISNLNITKDWVSFEARFSGVSREIRTPVKAVGAIYAAENGRGIFFEDDQDDDHPTPDFDESLKADNKKPGRPALKIVKK